MCGLLRIALISSRSDGERSFTAAEASAAAALVVVEAPIESVAMRSVSSAAAKVTSAVATAASTPEALRPDDSIVETP